MMIKKQKKTVQYFFLMQEIQHKFIQERQTETFCLTFFYKQIIRVYQYFLTDKMASNLNIDMLFKKYSQYFAYSQTASTHRHLDDKPTARTKHTGVQKQQIKSQTVKLKSTKTIKSKLKAENKDSLTDTKKTRTMVSSKVTPRCPVSAKQNEIKMGKVEHRMNKSITPDKPPRKSLSRTPVGASKKVGDKSNIRPHKENKQKNHRSKSKQYHLPTDRSVKLKTQRSKSRDKIGGDKCKNIKRKISKMNPKQTIKIRQYPQFALHTECIFDRDSYEQHFSVDEPKMRYNIPSRQKLKNQELFYEEEYQTPKRDFCEDRHFKIPLVSSREQKISMNQKQKHEQSSNEFHQRQSYYKQLIEKMKQEQQEKWRRTISILKEYRQVGDREMLDKVIDQSQQNRKSINSKEDKFEMYQKYKSMYNEDHIVSYCSPKQKISYIRSREASSKKLMEDLQQSHLNQIQLENHFSSNKSIGKDSSCKKLNFLINREEKKEIEYESNLRLQDVQEKESLENEEIFHAAKSVKEENLLSTHNVNIQQYLLSQSKKSDSARQDSPPFDRIQSKHQQQYQSQENSLIQFIQNQLQQVKNEKKDQDNAISSAVFEQVFASEMILFGEELLSSGEILHNFLRYTNQQFNKQPPKVENQAVEIADVIECSNSFILQLVRSFLHYIEKHMLEQFNKALVVPFGEKPLKMLKFMRDSAQNDDGQGGYQSIIPVSLFIEFEPTLKQKVPMSSNLQQYFFNHCVFDCINQNLDKLRPFGLKGLPPLCFQTNFPLMRFESVYEHLLINTKTILSFGIGRDIDECEEDDAFKIIDSTFRKLDKLILVETDQEWRDNNDLEFELKYDLAMAVADWIFKEQAKSLVYLIV